jgi:hypothetical protein
MQCIFPNCITQLKIKWNSCRTLGSSRVSQLHTRRLPSLIGWRVWEKSWWKLIWNLVILSSSAHKALALCSALWQIWDNISFFAWSRREGRRKIGNHKPVVTCKIKPWWEWDSDCSCLCPQRYGQECKTTLAQLVYNDDQFKKQYDCRIWVYVSQDFNLLKIGNSIISQVSAEKVLSKIGISRIEVCRW